MQFTKQSLLLRARAGDENAWHGLVALYRPLIVGWLRHQGLRPAEVDDLSQDVLLKVIKHLPSFQHSGQRGAFRCWLRTIARNALTDFWSGFWKARGQETPSGQDGRQQTLEMIEDRSSDLDRLWDEEHDQYVMRCLLDMMELEFDTLSVQAFRRLAVDGASGAAVAAELGMSLSAVYVAKCRVLKRLREEAQEFLD